MHKERNFSVTFKSYSPVNSMQQGEKEERRILPRKEGKGFRKEGAFDFNLEGRGEVNQTKAT